MSRSRSSRFALQLAVTAAGAILDYFVGRLTNTPSLGIAAWAALTLLAAATLDFVKDLWLEHHGRVSESGQVALSSGWVRVAGIVRGRMIRFRWTSVIGAIAIGVLAGIACYAFALATLVIRFLAVTGGPPLGLKSPYDQSAIIFISNFQASSATAWLMIASFAMALALRSPVVLPLGIMAVSVTNAAIVAIPSLTQVAAGMQSQVAVSLSTPEGRLLQLPDTWVFFGCAIPVIIGIIACCIINVSLS